MSRVRVGARDWLGVSRVCFWVFIGALLAARRFRELQVGGGVRRESLRRLQGVSGFFGNGRGYQGQVGVDTWLMGKGMAVAAKGSGQVGWLGSLAARV